MYPYTWMECVIDMFWGGALKPVWCVQRVLFRVNDHYTRVKVGRNQSRLRDDTDQVTHDMNHGEGREDGVNRPCRAVGCLLGEQHGRGVTISTCFDMALEKPCQGDTTLKPPEDEALCSIIDWDLLQKKVELFREMYPSIDVVGWYVTAAGVSEEDCALQTSFLDLNPASIVLVFNPCDSNVSEALRLYESEEHLVNGQKRIVFTRAHHEIVATEMEHIVVNQFTDLSTSDDVNMTSTALQSHQADVKSAVIMLIERVSELQQILIEMRDGMRPYDAEVARAIAAFVNRLPLSNDGTALFRQECSSDSVIEKQKVSLLTTLLATTMSGLSSLEEHSELEMMSLHAPSGTVTTGAAATPDTIRR